MSSWVQHCKEYAKANNVSYKEAMKQAKETYNKKQYEGGSLSSYLSGVKERGYNSVAKKTIARYGDETIDEVIIKRTPVSSVLTSIMNAVSFGKFSERQSKKGYDDLFHLYVQFKLKPSGVFITMEKQEMINIKTNPNSRAREGEEQNVVYNIPQGLSLAQLIANTEKYMGKRYFAYTAHGNNCQDFIVGIFKANGIGDAEDINFIKQDTESLFKKLGALKKISKGVTDLGNKAAAVMDIGEIKNKKKYIKPEETYEPEPVATNDTATLEPTDISGMGMRVASTNPWILHVKAYAKKHNISYWEAVKQARASYK